MQIEDLNLRLRRSEERLEQTERELRSQMDTIKGYEDSVVLSPHQVVDFPHQLRNNVRKIIAQLQTTDETRYVKALLDPFHPDCLGVRVPSRVPRSTITYNTHTEYTFRATSQNSGVMYITNYEQMSGDYYVALTGAAVQNFLNNVPINIPNAQLYQENDDQIYDVTVVSLGPANQMSVATAHDDTWHENFFKLRCVAAGTRILKTSKQDSESGSLDMVYSRDGSSFDEGHAFRTDLARNRPDRIRTYLAGQGCCLRETNGFILQSNKRPHDEASLELTDVKKMMNSAGHNFAPHGETSSVWFLAKTGLDPGTLYAARDFDKIASTAEVFIVLESLQQRHTTMSIVQDLQPGMTLSFETVYHIEGIADQTAYGFTQAHTAKLKSAATSLQLLDIIPVEQIFAPYSVRRPELLQMLLRDNEIRGFWDETLFPAIKDLVRYGADKLSDSEFLDDMIDALVDSAAGTLGYMAPQFLPAILSASSQLKDPLHDLASDALRAAATWAKKPAPTDHKRPAVTGPPLKMIEYFPQMPAYGEDVLKDN